ncbi:MAG: response regulator [Anaerolineales bacterium]|nr:response regulator [Anaerolineales bacterium]
MVQDEVRFNLWLKLLLIFLVISLVPLLITSFINISLTGTILRHQQIEDEQARLQDTVSDINRFLGTLAEDILLVSHSTAMHYVATDIHDKDWIGLQQSRQVLEAEFENLMENRNFSNASIYERVRFLDTEGFELVRVDNVNGQATIVTTYNFRRSEDYFARALDLTQDELYVSSVSLVKEYGRIQEPHNPVMHYSTPIYIGDELLGVLVTDVRAEGFLDLVSANLPTKTTAFLVDQDGYYLSHPDPTYRFGAELGQDYNLNNDYPTLAQALTQHEHGTLEIGEDLAVFQTIIPPGQADFHWGVFSIRPTDAILSPVRQQEATLALAFVLVGTLAIAIAFYFARSVSRPVVELTRISTLIAEGDLSQRVHNNRKDEIGVLARSFNSMAQQMGVLVDHLEERVNARTRDLQLAAEVSKQITTILDIDTLLQRLVLATAQAFDLHAVSIYLIDGDGKLAIRASANAQDGPLEIELSNPRSVAKRAAQTREAVLESVVDFTEVGHELAIPMLLGRHLLGVLSLQARELSHFDDDAMRVFKTLAEQLTIAVRNAQLFANAQASKRAAEMSSAAKSVFLANMSHELRTPLNAILGFTQLLNRDSTITADQREKLDIITNNSEHLLQLINDVLEMSKIEAGRVSLNLNSFDLYTMLYHLEQTLRARAEAKGLQFKVVRAPQLPRYVEADERKLRQVIINLIGNAIKFTKQGEITFMIQPHGDEYIRFEVKDTGPGIATTDMDRIFQPFSQTMSGQQLREGAGLGLAISREYVHLMGGQIGVQSIIGKGATFRVDIRVRVLNIAQIPPKTPQRRVVGLAAGQPAPKIMIVEDKWESRKLLQELLTPVGFILQAAIHGQDALKLLATWQPDLILMDMRMPVMDGYEATRIIKRSYPQIKIIAVTSSAFEHELSEILAVGCDDYVSKPFQESQLFDKIHTHLQVRFVYQSMEDIQAEPDIHLTPTDLEDLPLEWIDGLYKIAMTAQSGESLRWIEQIASLNPTLASALADLVKQYRFDTIMHLTHRSNEGN